MKKIFAALAALTTALVFTACTTTNTSDAGKMNLYPDLYKPSYAYRPIYEVNAHLRTTQVFLRKMEPSPGLPMFSRLPRTFPAKPHSMMHA